ncbi:MAG: hypothetical protein KJ749_02175, partial [Planctomycetes bacterium]|nr:hypothetical protein [Planctomycetota bacterium]
GSGAFIRLGTRNATRNPGRSLLTAGLIASATFVIVAMEAFHLGAEVDPTKRDSPTGGFALLAEAAVPLPYNVNSPDGREALNITGAAVDKLRNTRAFAFRLRSGDETSCLSLYRPTEPQLIGASDALIDRGGFVFSATMAESDTERRNPWTLLRREFPDGVVPVIGDEAAVKWQLHSGVGQEITITDEHGQEARLRFVALLGGSVLQNELAIAESRFVELFPSIDGHAFFLIEAPPDQAAEVAGILESALSTYAFDVTSTKQRLAAFQTVQNTYLSTFQTLGGLGLVLGTAGLAVVLLRNIGERRGELALMRALGFSRRALAWMVLAENGVLVISGLAAGAVPAFLAIAPHVLARPTEIPWWSISLTLVGVFGVSIGAGAFALVPVLRVPLVPALRRE